jgi:hypothetical protein
MEVVPLRPLGERRQTELLAVLRTRVDAWLQRWAVEAVGVTLRPMPWQAECREMALVGNASGRAGVWIVDADAEALGAWLAKAPRTGGQGMPARLAMAALDDLRAQLLGAVATARDGSAVPTQRHGWGFAVTLDAGFELRLFVDRALVERMVPVCPGPKPALTARKEASADVPVACTFLLDLGSVAVADVLGLAPGDVLVGQATLETPLQCRIGDATTPHNFRLIRQGHRFAALAHA